MAFPGHASLVAFGGRGSGVLEMSVDAVFVRRCLDNTASTFINDRSGTRCGRLGRRAVGRVVRALTTPKRKMKYLASDGFVSSGMGRCAKGGTNP